MELIDEALDEIARYVKLEVVSGAPTHTALTAEGLEQVNVAVAFGRYLVGALAGIVGADAHLSAVMLDEDPDARAELEDAIRRLIGDTNIFDTEQACQHRLKIDPVPTSEN